MRTMSRKIYLEMNPPTEEDPRPDTQRIRDALGEPVRFSLSVLRQLAVVLPDAAWKITATLGYDGAGWEVIRLEKGNTTAEHYAVAVDLGSTTVCMRLVNMQSGSVVASESRFNRQIAYGEDILNRVFYCRNHPEHLEEVRQATLESFREVMDALTDRTGIPAEAFSAMVVSGNTTMIHLFLGLDPFAVFASPYAPHACDFDFYSGSSLGLDIPGYVYCVPCRANYLGGDILSGLIATGLAEREEISVFLDIGTNGELVVGNRHFLLAGAGAAGPALEGGSVSTGMRAKTGAVSKVTMEDGKLRLHVIGDTKPEGLCGSGIVDLLSVLFLGGILDRMGKFRDGAWDYVERDGQRGVCYGEGLVLWQSDVDAFLRTKAAANTMVDYILEYAGIPMDQVDRFYVSGAFGTHLDKESAVSIGLYPDIPRERIVNAGNSSLEGAQKLLMNMDRICDIQRYLSAMEYIQFGAVTDFVSRMTAALAIPHTDLERYPSVKGKITS